MRDGELLDVRGAAALLGRSEKAIRADIARQRIPFRRLGGRRIVLRRSELERWIEGLSGVTVEEALDRATGGGR